jgi:hypothetical protein
MKATIITWLLILIAATDLAASPDLATHAPAKPPSQHTPPAPDPEVLRQGGDTIEDAVVVTLPHQSAGSTVGYGNQYEEACPFLSTSPDVVRV